MQSRSLGGARRRGDVLEPPSPGLVRVGDRDVALLGAVVFEAGLGDLDEAVLGVDVLEGGVGRACRTELCQSFLE